MSDRSLELMLAALCEGSLDARGTAALAARLEADAEARAAYLAYMDMHGRLITQPQLLGDYGGPTISRRRDVRRAGLRVMRIAAGIAVIGAVAAALAMMLAGRGGESVKPDRLVQPVAVLTGATDAAWNSEPIVPGASLEPQEIDLASGEVEIDFLGGASVRLIGPARLSIDTSRRGRLHFGQLVARVTHGSRGFEVHTPGARVVDLGTAFEVSVDERGDSSVLVHEGHVELTVLGELGASVQTFEMTVGSSARVVDGRAIIGNTSPATARADAYRAAVLADEPKAYWPLDDAGGSTEAADASGHGYGGANRGAVFGVEGPMGRTAAVFDGRASIDMGERPQFGFVRDFTAEAWVWIDPSQKDLGAIVTATHADGSKLVGGWVAGWSAPVGSITQPRLLLGNQRARSLELRDPPMSAGRWHHVAMSVGPDDVGRIYVDGELKLTQPLGPAIPDRTTLVIGRYAAGYGGWKGRLAHVAIYDRALADERIAAHFRAGGTGSP